MDKGTVLLIAIPLVIGIIGIFYFYMDFGKKWIMLRVIGPLQAWIPVQGTVQEIKFVTRAGANHIWLMTYTFELDGKTFTGKSSGSESGRSLLPYVTGSRIRLLVDPANPEHSRRVNEMLQLAFCAPGTENLKSVKRVRCEFAVDCLVILASAVAYGVVSAKYSYSAGASVAFYLIMALVLIGVGMLQMIKFIPGKLLG